MLLQFVFYCLIKLRWSKKSNISTSFSPNFLPNRQIPFSFWLLIIYPNSENLNQIIVNGSTILARSTGNYRRNTNVNVPPTPLGRLWSGRTRSIGHLGKHHFLIGCSTNPIARYDPDIVLPTESVDPGFKSEGRGRGEERKLLINEEGTKKREHFIRYFSLHFCKAVMQYIEHILKILFFTSTKTSWFPLQFVLHLQNQNWTSLILSSTRLGLTLTNLTQLVRERQVIFFFKKRSP